MQDIKTSADWSHLNWFTREFQKGFMLDSTRHEYGLRAKKNLHWNSVIGVWTNQIKTVVSRLALKEPSPFSNEGRPVDWSQGFAVSASSGPGRIDATGEFMFDVCWHSYRNSGNRICNFRSCATKAKLVGIELAFESEFGKIANSETSMTLILDDFAKLRESRARLKVMLYLYHDNNKQDLLECMQSLADAHPVDLNPPDSYLLIGASWSEHCWSPENRGSLWQFYGRAGDSLWKSLDILDAKQLL